MQRSKDVAAYLYQRLHTLYSLSRDPACREILRVARERGYPVQQIPELPRRGLCLPGNPIHIYLRYTEDRRGASHELFEAWVMDNIQYGIEYLPPEWESESPEAAARQFERLVVEGE